MDFGKMLIVFGIFMIIAGVAIGFSGKFFLLGQLPGDIHWSWGKTTFFFPVVSSFVISIVGTILLNRFLENKNIFILKIIYPVRMNKGTII